MTPCEEWPGRKDKDGYGVTERGPRRESKRWRAHRWCWTQAYGPIPDGLFVLHHCDNPSCVRLDHLYLGTTSDNMRDREDRGRNPASASPTCKRGHEYAEHGYERQGHRRCRVCDRLRQRASRLGVPVASLDHKSDTHASHDEAECSPP